MTVVLGGGPCGLAFASRTDRDVQIIEKEKRLGGLCRSFTISGCSFDYGAHAYWTGAPEARTFLEDGVSGALFTQLRNAQVFSHGTLLPFPFQANLFGLPPEVVAECLTGLFEARRRSSGGRVGSLRDWILATFGAGIYRHFLKNYNEKIWASPLTAIDPVWTKGRVSEPNVAEIISGALSRTEYTKTGNHYIGYPADGGFEALYEPHAKNVVQDVVFDEAIEIDTVRRRIALRSGKDVSFDRIVSTIPLTELVARTKDAPLAIREAADKLRYTSLCLVSMVYEGSRLSPIHRIYDADPSVPFHRLTMTSNSSPSLWSKPVFAVQGEISYTGNGVHPMSDDELVASTIRAVERISFLPNRAKPLAVDVRHVKHAYPISTHGSEDGRRAIMSFFQEHGIWCGGRFGEWRYINSDLAVQRGLDLARELG